MSLKRQLGALAAIAAVSALGCGKKNDNSNKGPSSGEPAGKVAAGSADKKSGGSTTAGATTAPRAATKLDGHSVYSMVDNRLTAHRYCGETFVADATTPGFVKYTRFGNTVRGAKKAWDLNQAQGDQRVAKLTGKTASMYVPLTAAQAKQTVIRLHAYAEAAQAISLKVNGGKDINAQAAAGWTTTEFTLPADALKEGENELIWFMGTAQVGVAWVAVGAEGWGDGPLPGAWDGNALNISKGCGMAWYAYVPSNATLGASVADAACKLQIKVTGEDGKSVTGVVSGEGAVTLGDLGGKAARVDVAVDGCERAVLKDLSLRMPGAPVAPARGPAPKYVVLWVMDSLRADRVRPFNPKARPEAPNFEKLAADSAMFTQMFTQGNESRVSHASIWTSLYPIVHRSIEEKEILDLKWFSIEEVAKAASLKTFGVSGNGYIRPKRGFGDKWDEYVNHIEKELGLKGEDITNQGLAYIEGKRDPWFLYMGTIDTHVSWRPKEPWMSKLESGYSGRFEKSFSGEDAGAVAAGKMTLTDAEIKHIRALYDSNVSYQDDLLGQFIEKLKAAGIWEQTMLIVTADHGDEQMEDGRVGHGASVRDMLVHVPLVIHYPPMIKGGLISEGVESVDIVPTLADALGVAVNPEWQGASLIDLSHGVGGGYPRLSVASQMENAHGGRLAHWKIRVNGAGAPRVYNLSTDGSEATDIYGKASAAIGTRMMLDSMWVFRNWNSSWKKARWGNAANVSAAFASDVTN